MAVTSEASDIRKRKRSTHKELAPHKTRKARDNKPASSGEVQSEIHHLEEEIQQSRKNLNNIGKLLEIARCADVLKRRLATASLCRAFLRLMTSENFTRTHGATGHGAIIGKWLKERLEEYQALLLKSIRSPNPETNKASLDFFMQLMREEQCSEDAVNPKSMLSELLDALVESEGGKQLRFYFIESYAARYCDIMHYIYSILGSAAPNSSRVYDIDQQIELLTDLSRASLNSDSNFDMFLDSGSHTKSRPKFASKSIKKQAGEAWLCVMGKDLNKIQRKTLLGLLSTSIAPCTQRLERLMDFLTDSFDIGGSTSLLALSGLFYLIREKNLDYPQFYQKLYSMLDSMILHSKHRSRFLRLLDTFLASTHLPAVMIASFIKRTARLCLYSPPPGVAVIVPWIYNLLKSHPTCTFMIHRPDFRIALGENELERVESDDLFWMEESDPMETDAINSSLWEIETLQSHYHPNIATICKIISEQFTKQAYNLEDFLDHSYSSLLDSELAKDMKRPPVVEFEIPKKIFYRYEEPCFDNLTTKLWNFDA